MKLLQKILVISVSMSLVVSLYSCASVSAQKESVAREGEIHLQMGSNYLREGKIELALFELTKASRLMPKNPEVHFALGTVHLMQEEPELAVEEFQKTTQLDPGLADAYNNLGYAYLKLGKWDEAIEACKKALSEVTYGTPERAMTIMGWAYYKKGDPARGLEMLKKALNIKGDLPDTENRMATIYLEEGNIEKAKIILVDLVKRLPKFPGARLNLGIVYYKEKDFVAARREFKAVINLVNRTSEEARLARGYLDLIE